MDTTEIYKILGGIPRVQLLKEEFKVSYPNVFVGMTALHPEDPARVLVVDYYADRFDTETKQVKFPGGTGKRGDTIVFTTLLREANEEILGGSDGVLIDAFFPVAKHLLHARNVGDSDHVKYLVVVRTTGLILPYMYEEDAHTDEYGRETSEIVCNHRYEPVEALTRELFPTHRKMFRELCELLAPHIPEYTFALRDLESQKRGR